MAKLPRDPAPRLALAAGLLLAAAPAAAEPVDLLGTWHVLVHYTDDHSARPEALRWEDHVWVFEKAGTRLQWTDYPIVVFRDESGRFEALGTNRARRIVHAWEPNEGQAAQIASGLEVNPRGSKSKTLRGSDEQGWRSQSRPAPTSVTVVTYTEHWSIAGAPQRPVFERHDVLGSPSAEGMDGRTRFTTTEIDPGAGVLRGRFERDDSRRGTFRMLRAGPVEGVKGSGKTQGERLMEAWFGEWASDVRGGRDELHEEIVRRLRAGEELPEGARQEIRDEIRRSLERAMRRRGFDPRDQEQEIEALVDQIEVQLLEEGRSIEEAVRMIEEGEIAP